MNLILFSVSSRRWIVVVCIFSCSSCASSTSWNPVSVPTFSCAIPAMKISFCSCNRHFAVPLRRLLCSCSQPGEGLLYPFTVWGWCSYRSNSWECCRLVSARRLSISASVDLNRAVIIWTSSFVCFSASFKLSLVI